jgi:hypothetical protein
MICSFKNATVLILSLLFISGCRKFVDVNAPTTSLNTENVYNSNNTAIAVLSGIYIKMAQSVTSGIAGVSFYTSLSGDELALYGGKNNQSPTLVAYYTNSLNNSNTSTSDFCYVIYPILFEANLAIERLNNSKNLSVNFRNTLIGEALFVRAFCYFHLVNLYGSVPLATTSDYTVNANLKRSSVTEVYNLIKSDLLEAKRLLPDRYLNVDLTTSSQERVRPTKWAASALLSRVYLYTEAFDLANKESSEIINSPLFDIVPLSQVFLKNSKESILQFSTVNINSNTPDAKLFILPATGPQTNGIFPVYLSSQLISEFKTGDLRKTEWIDSVKVGTSVYYYSYKYRNNMGSSISEYMTVFRIAEQYLIRSEARSMIGDNDGSLKDLNVIRNRAGLPELKSNQFPEIKLHIIEERKYEFFTEWGHRWFDLKRTNMLDSVMAKVSLEKGATWDKNWKFYPFRLSDIKANPNLTQNPGYN